MMRAITILVYCLIGAAGVAVVVRSRRRPDELAPAATMLDRAMASRASRLTLIAFWWWLGWHFLVGNAT